MKRALWHVNDLLRLGLVYQARHLHRFGERDFAVRIKELGDFHLRPRSADAAVVSQVFSFRQYDTKPFAQHPRLLHAYRDILARGRRPLILDLGANNGASARWFHREYPDASIIAVEPDADNARMCRLNTSGFPVHVVEAAIGGSPGQATLDTSKMGSLSYVATRETNGDVPVVTVPQILAEREGGGELFIVKIDIEGFEDDLFATNIEWVADAHVVMIELHDYKFPERDTSRHFQQTMGELPFQLLVSGENLIYVRHS